TGIFPPSESSDGAAVVYVEARSPELHRLHKEIGQIVPVKESDFEYHPHATVAYVKPDVASRYKGMKLADGMSFTVYSITVSDRDGRHTQIPLGGAQQGPYELKGSETRGFDIVDTRTGKPYAT